MYKLMSVAAYLAIMLALFCFFAVVLYFAGESSQIIQIGLLLIAGTVFLVVCLAILVAIIKTLGLQQEKQPLGLPQGSIRAIIAIFLILIFAVMAVFLYTNTALPATYKSIGITQEQLNKIPPDQILSQQPSSENKTLFDVERKVGKSTASEDIAKQVTTAMITLITAISAFYFGSKSATTEEEPPEAASKPVIKSIEPNKGAQGTIKEIKISGNNLQNAKTVKLVDKNNNEIPGKSISSSKKMVTAKFDTGALKPGTYHVVVVNKDGEEVRQENESLRERVVVT